MMELETRVSAVQNFARCELRGAHAPRRWVVAALLLICVFTFAGCKKKKEAPIAPQAEAPPITQPAPQPATQPATAPPTAPTAAENAGTSPPVSPKPKAKARSRAQTKKKTESATTSNGNHGTVLPTIPATEPTTPLSTTAAGAGSTETTTSGNHTIVRGGGAGAPGTSISTGIPDAQEVRTKAETDKYLYDADKNVKSLNRVPNDDDRAMLDQIRNYTAQSRSANSDGDFVRANNLAQKAYLLSVELVKR